MELNKLKETIAYGCFAEQSKFTEMDLIDFKDKDYIAFEARAENIKTNAEKLLESQRLILANLGRDVRIEIDISDEVAYITLRSVCESKEPIANSATVVCPSCSEQIRLGDFTMGYASYDDDMINTCPKCGRFLGNRL
jgi:rubrerythrin